MQVVTDKTYRDTGNARGTSVDGLGSCHAKDGE